MNKGDLYKVEAAKTILALFCSMSQTARQELIKIILDEQSNNKEVVRLVRSYLELIHVKIALSNEHYLDEKINEDDYKAMQKERRGTSEEFIREYSQIEDDEEVILGYLLRYVGGGKE